MKITNYGWSTSSRTRPLAVFGGRPAGNIAEQARDPGGLTLIYIRLFHKLRTLFRDAV